MLAVRTIFIGCQFGGNFFVQPNQVHVGREFQHVAKFFRREFYINFFQILGPGADLLMRYGIEEFSCLPVITHIMALGKKPGLRVFFSQPVLIIQRKDFFHQPSCRLQVEFFF